MAKKPNYSKREIHKIIRDEMKHMPSDWELTRLRTREEDDGSFTWLATIVDEKGKEAGSVVVDDDWAIPDFYWTYEPDPRIR